MKTATLAHLIISLLLLSFFMVPNQSGAQSGSYQEPSERFSREALTQMLAPIALYPDVLLSQILMASTYPIEVIEADRWIRSHSELTGEDLDTELLDKDWEPSVKALCHFPTVLNLMSERIDETTNIGNAFLVQEEEVMDVIQELRGQAYDQGNLLSTFEQEVIVEQTTILIVPADPRTIFVPYYDPFYIYGPWWYPDYPPYYWAPGRVKERRRMYYWPRFYSGFGFGTWSYFDWRRHSIYIDARKRPRFVRRDRWFTHPGPWLHVPRHRKGVAYRDKHTARKYGQYPYTPRKYQRDTRGFPEDHDRRGTQLPSRVPSLGDHRSRFQFPDRTMPWDDRVQFDRNRAAREKAERDRQQREKMARERRERQQAEQDRRERERVRIEQERRQKESIAREREMRTRSEQERLHREHVERDRRVRPRGDRQVNTWKQFEGKRREGNRDNVFNRVEDGRKERQSSKRGRTSRQGRIEGSGSRGGVIKGNNSGREDKRFRLR